MCGQYAHRASVEDVLAGREQVAGLKELRENAVSPRTRVIRLAWPPVAAVRNLEIGVTDRLRAHDRWRTLASPEICLAKLCAKRGRRDASGRAGRAAGEIHGANQEKDGQVVLVAPIVLVHVDSTVDYPDVSPVNGTEALGHPLAPKAIESLPQSRSAPREDNCSRVNVLDDGIHDLITRLVGCGRPDAKHIRERAQADLMKQAVEPYPQAKIRGQCLTKPSVDSSEMLLQSAENPLESGFAHPEVLDPVVLRPPLQSRCTLSVHTPLE